MFVEKNISLKGQEINSTRINEFSENDDELLNATFSNVSYRKPAKNGTRNKDAFKDNLITSFTVDVYTNKNESVSQEDKIKGNIRDDDTKEENPSPKNDPLSVKDLCKFIEERNLNDARELVEKYSMASLNYNDEDTTKIVNAINTSINNVNIENGANEVNEVNIMCDLLTFAFNDLNLSEKSLSDILPKGIKKCVDYYQSNYNTTQGSYFGQCVKDMKNLIKTASSKLNKDNEDVVKSRVVEQIGQYLEVVMKDKGNVYNLSNFNYDNDNVSNLIKSIKLHSNFISQIYEDNKELAKQASEELVSKTMEVLIDGAKEIYNDTNKSQEDKERALFNVLEFICYYGRGKEGNQAILNGFVAIFGCIVDACNKGLLNKNYIGEKSAVIMKFYGTKNLKMLNEFKEKFCDDLAKYYCDLAVDKLEETKSTVDINDMLAKTSLMNRIKNAYKKCSGKDYYKDYVTKLVSTLADKLYQIALNGVWDNKSEIAVAYIDCVKSILGDHSKLDSLLAEYEKEECVKKEYEDKIYKSFRSIIISEMDNLGYKSYFNMYLCKLKDELPNIYARLRKDEDIKVIFNSKKECSLSFNKAINDKKDINMVGLREFFGLES